MSRNAKKQEPAVSSCFCSSCDQLCGHACKSPAAFTRINRHSPANTPTGCLPYERFPMTVDQPLRQLPRESLRLLHPAGENDRHRIRARLHPINRILHCCDQLGNRDVPGEDAEQHPENRTKRERFAHYTVFFGDFLRIGLDVPQTGNFFDDPVHRCTKTKNPTQS